MWVDAVFIIFISVCTALLGEGITWFLVYKTEKYQQLKAEVERQCKKIEKRKEGGDPGDAKARKKLERDEERLKATNKDLTLVKMKSMLSIGLTFTVLMGMFNSIFDGRVVAHLPFTPIGLLQGFSHRNLPGDDYTHCSFVFLYILCTMCIRQNVQKALGFAPSRAAAKHNPGMFAPPGATPRF